MVGVRRTVGNPARRVKPAWPSDRLPLVHPLRQRLMAFDPFRIAVDQMVADVAGQQGETHQLLHHVDDAVVVLRGLHTAVVVEFVERLRGQVAYTGPEALIAQMRLDVERARGQRPRRRSVRRRPGSPSR